MTNRDDIALCRDDPGYTPPVRSIPALIAALAGADEETADAVERALGRAGAVAGRAAVAALEGAPELHRARLLRLVGRVVPATPEPALFDALRAALADPSPRCRRAAARGLGNSADPRAEDALLDALAAGETLDVQRSLVEALGKVGGERSRGALHELAAQDRELARRVERARLLIERRSARDAPSAIRLDRALPGPARVAFRCRRGLAAVLADELAAFRPRVAAEERVEIEHAGALAELLVARTALELGIVVPVAGAGGADDIAAALTSDAALERLAAWTQGTPRFRAEWTRGGHHRALTWAVAERVAARSRAVVNDPRAASWIVRADPERATELVLVPRLDPDPRFAYRVSDVPAASHPTIAAALARLAGVRAGDVVWDPFVGSALDLVERARLGPYARLVGTDVDPRAVAAAERNLASAGVARAAVFRADALRFDPGPVSLILTNPPMGRRVARDGTLDALLGALVLRARELLVPGGRLVWLTPLERRTERAARDAGLDVTRGPAVDMGGFDATIQVLKRPA